MVLYAIKVCYGEYEGYLSSWWNPTKDLNDAMIFIGLNEAKEMLIRYSDTFDYESTPKIDLVKWDVKETIIR
jgi:hypothetical protein